MNLTLWITTGLLATVALAGGISKTFVSTHLRRGERQFVALNLVYLALAGFIAWGRFGPHSFS